MIERLENYNKHLLDFNRPMDGTDKSKNVVDELMKLRVERDELKKEIGDLKENKKKRESEYDGVWARKEYYKKEVVELGKKVEKLDALREKEVRQLGEDLTLKMKEVHDE